jgi:hypothetical protein
VPDACGILDYIRVLRGTKGNPVGS